MAFSSGRAVFTMSIRWGGETMVMKTQMYICRQDRKHVLSHKTHVKKIYSQTKQSEQRHTCNRLLKPYQPDNSDSYNSFTKY